MCTFKFYITICDVKRSCLGKPKQNNLNFHQFQILNYWLNIRNNKILGIIVQTFKFNLENKTLGVVVQKF